MFGRDFGFGDLWDAATDAAEAAARLTGNDKLADLIDDVDDAIEDVFDLED